MFVRWPRQAQDSETDSSSSGYSPPPAATQVSPPATTEVTPPAATQVTPPATTQVTPPTTTQVTVKNVPRFRLGKKCWSQE